MTDETIIRFDDVAFEYTHKEPILNEVSFSLRQGAKFTLMGQNGAGKSTLFQLITGSLKPTKGLIHVGQGLTVATAHQVIPPAKTTLTITEFFKEILKKEQYHIQQHIDEVLEVVNLKVAPTTIIKSLSGGQQARLLLASALIQDPDILLLDEPTNNLDKAGIEHLTQFLIDYQKTCLVISHDADFLNSFTEGVLYLDVFTHKIERYLGNYYDVMEEIEIRREKENRKNAQLAKEIQDNKDKANMFAHKGGKMRLVARKMRDAAEEMEAAKVDVRKEDKTIRPFIIPTQEDILGEIMHISSYTTMRNHKIIEHEKEISLKRNMRLQLVGPNGIGKSTLLEMLASGTAEGAQIAKGVVVGYYRQDFSTLNFEDTVYDSLNSVMAGSNEEFLRSTAAGFLISSKLIKSKIGSLSEGQKGLVAFARLVLQKPGLLILDEPTNHINFRHLPVIAEALDAYEGAMILVSHVPEFVGQIRIDEVLDLER